MRIAARAGDAQTRLVCADDRSLTNGGFETLLGVDQFACGNTRRGLNGRDRERALEEVAHRLSRACDGQELIKVQITRARQNTLPVLHGGAYSSRELGLRRCRTGRAVSSLGTVFGD